MAKGKSVFLCRSCGAESSKWIGKCPSCNEWNTYVEELVEKRDDKFVWRKDEKRKADDGKPRRLSDIKQDESLRIDTLDSELNRVLGGGLVPGSIILIGGEPGVGKSTLLLQIALKLKDLPLLYVSGEESLSQIKMRASRMKGENENLFLLSETSTQKIFKQAKELEPAIMIIDSIQTLYSEFIEATPGSISQIRESTGELQRFAKETGTAVILVGHVTKDGIIAGPKILEHMVDAVLSFEGDQNYNYRILRSSKNRFGSAAELGIYEMKAEGLREVVNPSEILLSSRDDQLSGMAIAATMEGLRSMLIEVQALVANSHYGTPQRTATGFDLRRLHMLLAVCEKRLGYKLGMKDVFLNIAGGIRVDDPAIDLAVIVSIMSSYEDQAVSSKFCFAAEVGLSGEVRNVNRLEQRISEADKLGFEKIFIARNALKGFDTSPYRIEIIEIGRIYELVKHLF